MRLLGVRASTRGLAGKQPSFTSNKAIIFTMPATATIVASLCSEHSTCSDLKLGAKRADFIGN